jgi:type IV secretion system protein VirD4
LSGRHRNRFLRRAFLLGAALLVVGVGDRDTGSGVRLIVVGVLLVAVPCGAWWRRWSGSIGYVRRGAWRSRRNHGMASRWQILRTASRWAVRRQMRTLRPSFGDLPWWRRLFVPTTEIATPLCRVGWLTIWSPCEDAVVLFGGPRVGKSGELGCRILDAPGAVIATSTRTDLFDLTATLRSATGPVWVFNPSGVGGLATTVTFDPLVGCESPKTAFERATDLMAGVDVGSAGSSLGSGHDHEYWAGQGRRVLTAILHAAALGGCSMHDVHAWVGQPTTHAAEMQRHLRRSREPVFEADLAQFVDTNTNTRTSISTTIMPALQWLGEATAARAAGQQVGREPVIDESGVTVPDDVADTAQPLDVEALLYQCGTVYLLGAQEAQVAPLVTALTGHVARTARQVAGRQPGGRLDPPLTLVLDEAALICPIPLDEWTADMGGRNVTIHIAAQSRPQLRKRWGHDGAAAILNNAASVVIFGGTRDPDDLQAYSTLAGEREERIVTRDHTGKVLSETTHRVPVLTPAQIAQLKAGRVLVIRRGMPPVIGKVTMAWQPETSAQSSGPRSGPSEPRSAPWCGPGGARAGSGTGANSKPRSAKWPKRSARPWSSRASSARRLPAATPSNAPGNWKPNARTTNASTHNPPGRTSTSSPTRTRPASPVSAMTDRRRWLTHPILAWRAFTAALAERADAEAQAAGLTVDLLPGGLRRYRDPRLDQLAAHRDTDYISTAHSEAGPAAPANRKTDRRTEHAGPSRPDGAGAVPAPTVPHQGRSGFACASHPTAYGGPGPGTPSSAGS